MEIGDEALINHFNFLMKSHTELAPKFYTSIFVLMHEDLSHNMRFPTMW